MVRKNIYHLIRYPKKPTANGLFNCIKNLSENSERIASFIKVHTDEYNYTILPSTIPYSQDKRASVIANIVGNFTRTKFLLNWTINGGEVFMYYVIVGKGDNPYIADRLFYCIYLYILYSVDFLKNEYRDNKRKLRRRGKAVRGHARTYASEMYKKSLKDMEKKLKQILTPLYPHYTYTQEWEIIRYIDERFKLRIKRKPGPKNLGSPSINQYHGRGIHQIHNKWPI